MSNEKRVTNEDMALLFSLIYEACPELKPYAMYDQLPEYYENKEIDHKKRRNKR